ncbi:MAG: GNAT family N-acetyltransferase [Demequina sp.]|nr:GNAT family N-acetyltransferase [Demequina sp.]
MTEQSSYRVVDIPLDRSDEMLDVDGWAFANTAQVATVDILKGVIDWDRARGIEVADAAVAPVGTMVAVHSSHPYEMRVPGGGTVATSGLTWVGVHSGHRRRGLLTRMIDDHFARALARGEVVSTLYAAETAIYQRFGYGLACQSYFYGGGRGPELREIPGSDDLRLELVSADVDKHSQIVRDVLARVKRPGAHATIGDPLMRDLFIDPELWREGAEQLRFAWVSDAEGPAAFAIFARKLGWTNGAPDGEFGMWTWAAATGAAERRLLSVVLDLDLVAKVKMRNIPADGPFVTLLKDIRSAQFTVRDNIWVRLLDVPKALAARSYGADADVTVEITDKQLPDNAGVWRFAIAGGEASVTRAEGPAQVTIPTQELGAAYLGGVTLASLADAGLVTGEPAAIAALSAAFVGDQLPISPVSF